MQKQLCRGSVRKGLEKRPQRWQAMLGCDPLCTSVKWRKRHGKEQDCISVIVFGVTLVLMMIKVLYLQSEVSSLSTRQTRTCCIAQWHMPLWKNQYFQNNNHTPQECACRWVYVCMVPRLHGLFLEEGQSLGSTQLQCRLYYINRISRIQGNFRAKRLVLYLPLQQLFVSLIAALSKNPE